eukprot:19126-Heterococcus_DN1.PRE.1
MQYQCTYFDSVSEALDNAIISYSIALVSSFTALSTLRYVNALPWPVYTRKYAVTQFINSSADYCNCSIKLAMLENSGRALQTNPYAESIVYASKFSASILPGTPPGAVCTACNSSSYSSITQAQVNITHTIKFQRMFTVVFNV